MSERPTVLLVEDNPDTRLLVTVMLEESYRVVEAASAEEALVLLPMAAPALFLIDITLPGMDGHQLLAAIRRLPDFAATPAIAFTAHAMDGDRERFLAAGFDGYVSKPILSEHELLAAVKSVLRGA
jgi:CheY-like chemotaxis protein